MVKRGSSGVQNWVHILPAVRVMTLGRHLGSVSLHFPICNREMIAVPAVIAGHGAS